jgi:hypothetical protein
MAFLDNSRYFGLPTVEATDAAGRPVVAVKLRRLPATAGDPVIVEERDRLDILALARYNDSTRFWHIADANSELEAETLTAVPGRTIEVPK